MGKIEKTYILSYNVAIKDKATYDRLIALLKDEEGDTGNMWLASAQVDDNFMNDSFDVVVIRALVKAIKIRGENEGQREKEKQD